jgi:thiamine-monophosphate kinase
LIRERDVIARLRRIATAPEARGLNDDVAVIGNLVLTHDSIAEGVHFLPFDPPASVGWKLVAVNLSDLAAKGAEPRAALLSLSIVGDGRWEESFLSGIEAACESYGLALVGGDTFALPEGAPRVLGLTAIGRSASPVPSRSGGKPEDELWLVGWIGDSAAGLAQLKANRRADGPLVDTYRQPIPRLAAGQTLAPLATASMDVSDGLLLDALRLGRASGCTVEIALDAVPLSDAFISDRGASLEALMFASSGGDDYALLFALPAGVDPMSAGVPDGTPLARIGRLAGGTSPLSLTYQGRPIDLPQTLGYEHRG